MATKPMNAPITNATQKGETNEQHQNVTKPIMFRDPTVLSTTHQVTSQTSTQPWAMNVRRDDNHEHV